MIQRNLSAKNLARQDLERVIKSAFQGRSCELLFTTDPEVSQFSGLLGTSSLVRGNGRIAIVESGETIRVRLELELFGSNLGNAIGAISLLAGLFSLGTTILLYWILRDNACTAVVNEMDRIVDEISLELENL